MPLSRPPLLTLLQEVLGWTLDRTADLPKSQRFTFGQRLDGLEAWGGRDQSGVVRLWDLQGGSLSRRDI
jgi:hypothetical protein